MESQNNEFKKVNCCKELLVLNIFKGKKYTQVAPYSCRGDQYRSVWSFAERQMFWNERHMRSCVFRFFYGEITKCSQGPRSNFWIEGAECLASQGREGSWGNNRVTILASFFFNFFPFFFNYLAVATCSCLLLGFFSFFISKYWKKCMYIISTQSFCLLLLDFRARFPKITAKMLMRCSSPEL